MSLSDLKRSARTLVVIVGIAVIPLIYSGALIWANQDPTHNLNGVVAAVVNLDEPASLDDTTLDLGATLTTKLTTADSETNFDWRAMDAAAAASQLDSGDVLAVLTIPEDFSARAASVGDPDPMLASTAGLSIRTNDGANMVAGTIATSIGSRVRETLASELSDEYLHSIYVGFTTVHDKVADAAGGADELAAGAVTAEQGAGQLVVGLDDLANGSALLADGTGTLASGADRTSAGADTLSAGLATLQSTTAALPDQAAQLAAGAQDASAGSAALATALQGLGSGADRVAAGSSGALAGSQQVQGGLSALSAQSSALSAEAADVSIGIDSLIDGYAAMTDDQRLAALQQLSTDAGNVVTATETAQGSVQALAHGADALVGSADAGTGLAALAPGAAALATGATDAAAGATSLSTGVGAVAAGTSAFSLQVPELVSAISSAAGGAAALSEGASQVADGANTLATSTGALTAGSVKARNGGEQLNSGLRALEEGQATLSGGLHAGLDGIPSYTDEEADHLSSVTAEPVSIDTGREHEVPAYGYGLAPYFLALALWVGALAFYLMMQPLSRRAVAGRRPVVAVALISYLPGVAMGIVQSTLAVLVLTRGIGIEPVNTWGLFGMMVLTSLTFVAINQALVALLGAPGRFVGLMLIVLQLSAAGGTYPIQTAPSFLQAISQWLPLTHSVESFRSLIAGGDIGIAQGVAVLVAWLGGALVVTVIAAVRARRAVGAEESVPTGEETSERATPAELLSSVRNPG